ncbi:protein translocase subunit secB [Litorimonas taeanensis]|uniref:Protein-export protein SecB n=2 Tax=Litorimonas taeanensis TaxID=568099 RepID=A0A420WEN4_9PROT|nr:protein-export chaperone SecB [Litorimonas taeanensis]RKQ69425.1 protein translocase subunit secB [Litorimonas taeanensis]
MAKKPKKEQEDDSLSIEGEAAPTPATEQPQEQAAGPMLSVLAQYTKDLSFENPNAPDSLRSGLPAPQIGINIEIGRQMLENDNVEVTLMLRAEASRGSDVAFIAELEYAGLFAFQGVSVEEIQPLILIECPRLLFPFARQIMAEMTQNGGFPPIMLEPPDFAAMFREEMMRRAADAPTN